MLCKPCREQTPGGAPAPPPDIPAARVTRCDQCARVIVALKGVVVGVDDATLALLARFGLSVAAEPLLEYKRGST
jgi:hypothetical protein